jgi:heme-based aerotactic transducer
LNFEQQLVLEQYEKANEEARLQIEQMKNKLKEQLKAMVQELSAISSQASSSVAELTDQTKDILRCAEEASMITDISEQQSAEGQGKLRHQQTTMLSIQQMMKKIQTVDEQIR